MSEHGSYAQGVPSWVDLAATDMTGAQRFYGELLGWSFDEGTEDYGGYINCRLRGKTVAGMAPRQDESIPSAWTTYLAVDDAHATAKAVTEHGGTMMVEPMVVGPNGTMAIAQDATGAVVGMWQAGEHLGAQLVNEPGTVTWNEVNSRDGAAADTFYSGVFGVTPQKIDAEGLDYVTYQVDGKDVGGRLQMTDEWPDSIPPHWMTYFAIADADGAAERVRELGGTVSHGPFDSPFGRTLVVLDPWSAVFSLIQVPAATA